MRNAASSLHKGGIDMTKLEEQQKGLEVELKNK
jgi:hypothetical protein